MKWTAADIKKQVNESLKNFDGEIWKDIPGYEGIYQVSNFARVKRLAFCYTTRNRWREHIRHFEARMHKYHINHRGMPRIELSKNGVQKIFSVSRLVAVAFVPNPKNLPNVCHNDDNPINNFPNNLFWGTTKDNVDDKVRKNRQAKGENNGKTYLTEKQIKEIRRKYSPEKKNGPLLADEYKTTRTNIYYIVHRKNWKHIA